MKPARRRPSSATPKAAPPAATTASAAASTPSRSERKSGTGARKAANPPAGATASGTGAGAAAGAGASAATPSKSPRAKLPDILFEGDRPAGATPSGPGARYALGPEPPRAPAQAPDELTDLPEAYGTETLWLTARDPHWLYAHWDLTRDQLRKHNALSADGHLVLRVFENSVAGKPVEVEHVHPESRNWFVHVGRGGTRYLAQIGYHTPEGPWVTISTSAATLTPPDSLAEDTSLRFATLPSEVPFQQLLAVVKSAVSESMPLIEAIQQLRDAGQTSLPDISHGAPAQWSLDQERALAELVRVDSVRRVWMGSLEITELIRRKLLQEISSQIAGQFSLPSSISVGSVTSPFGQREHAKGFWFNVNAELIIYGATEPSAQVKIGPRAIKLRPDGTFSYRFALPDGDYALPVVATSADGSDRRSAELEFARHTAYRGDVGTHPQDTRLRPPHVAHVA